MKTKKQIFIPVLVLLVLILIYALGFSSNVAYTNKDFILSRSDYAMADFNAKSQKMNNLLFYYTIVLFLMLLAVYAVQSHKRTKYLLSNVITISILSAGMVGFALINFIKLPGFIAEYNKILTDHPEQIEISQRISSLIPTKGMYYFGLVLSVVSLLYAILMIILLILKMKHQKEYIAKRNEVLANAKEV
ncbi:MAG: hypothetical protein ACOX56_00065 [Acholeplasmataceae bacterium]|jgi:hypothetical protein